MYKASNVSLAAYFLQLILFYFFHKIFPLTGLDVLNQAVDGEERGPVWLDRIIIVLDKEEYFGEISAFVCKNHLALDSKKENEKYWNRKSSIGSDGDVKFTMYGLMCPLGPLHVIPQGLSCLFSGLTLSHLLNLDSQPVFYQRTLHNTGPIMQHYRAFLA